MGKLLWAFLVAIIMAALATPTFALINPEDILGVWTLDEGAGNDVEDLSANEHHGEIVGDVKWVEGKFGTALEMEGNGYVRIEHEEDMDLETFSMTAWIKVPKIVDPYQFVMGKGAWPDRNYALWIRPGTIVVGTSEGANQVPGNSVVGGDWYHVAGTYDLEFLKIYVNGELNNQVALSGIPKTPVAPLIIGGEPPPGTNHLHGTIDEAGVFKVALEEDDIKRIMDNGLKLSVTAVEPGEKLCTTWGALRSTY